MSERWDFNWCIFWASWVCTLILWQYLSDFTQTVSGHNWGRATISKTDTYLYAYFTNPVVKKSNLYSVMCQCYFLRNSLFSSRLTYVVWEIRYLLQLPEVYTASTKNAFFIRINKCAPFRCSFLFHHCNILVEHESYWPN